jgi:hypothetical protein
MHRRDLLESIRISLLKAQDEVARTFDLQADGFSMVEAYYLVQSAKSTLRRVNTHLDHIDKLIQG